MYEKHRMIIVYYWHDKLHTSPLNIWRVLSSSCRRQFSMSTSYSLGACAHITFSTFALSSSWAISCVFNKLSAIFVFVFWNRSLIVVEYK